MKNRKSQKLLLLIFSIVFFSCNKKDDSSDVKLCHNISVTVKNESSFELHVGVNIDSESFIQSGSQKVFNLIEDGWVLGFDEVFIIACKKSEYNPGMGSCDNPVQKDFDVSSCQSFSVTFIDSDF